MYLTSEDKHDVMLLCLAETALASVANRAKPNSRRQNKIKTAISNITLADETYSGTLSAADYAEAEVIFEQIESYINGISLKG